jgi:ATP-dependent DNA helicase PIF1
MSSRAILSTKNEHVNRLNAMMIERFSGEEKIYYSFDTVVDDPQNHFPIDFLNSITPNGLPPHELKLKINCPVILLRNLDPNDLCNGTRLIVRALQDNRCWAGCLIFLYIFGHVGKPFYSLCICT